MTIRTSTDGAGPVLFKRVATLQANPDRLRITEAIQAFNSLSLEGLREFALQDRVETKFVLREDQLAGILADIRDDYRVLEVGHRRLNLYRTLYFDTGDFDMYRRHHAGALNRTKVRSREYVDTHHAFFEIKVRNNKRRVIKNRLATRQFQTSLDIRTRSFLAPHASYAPDDLFPVVQNSYRRVTFASVHRCERLTIDLDLGFYTREQQSDLSGFVIAEVKQESFSLQSPFMQQMRRLGLRSQGFSKYCMGINLLYPAIESNNFKARHMKLEKLRKGFHLHDTNL